VNRPLFSAKPLALLSVGVLTLAACGGGSDDNQASSGGGAPANGDVP
jgi:ribose transport system substrate-binding protein